MEELLKLRAKKCRYDIIRMIDGAGSGHIGGALSSVDLYVAILDTMTENDRLVVSHGHSSAAVYAALGNSGYFDVEDAVSAFRRQKPYEGHPSILVNGVEWCSGSLGQGLSVACGFALAKKLQKEPGKVFVVMGDGEQQKGQLQEAREFAVKFKLDNLIALIDWNGLQACGTLADTTCQNLGDKYRMSGWNTVEVDGHSLQDIKTALSNSGPLVILAKTVMGKGIPEIENDFHFHGTVIKKELAQKSLSSFSLTEEEQAFLKQNKSKKTQKGYPIPTLPLKSGRTYDVGTFSDIRSAMGNALYDLAKENPEVPMAAFDCDLEGSVKLTAFKNLRPDSFIECGIAEHNAATAAAAMTKSGVMAIHADFAMFNIAETYSQNRMSDINHAPIKLFSTHAGLDVGEDGKTHHSIDYISILGNLYGFRVIVPADANQADAAVRYAMSVADPVAVIGGRSPMPVLTDSKGELLDFSYGKGQWLTEGTDGVIITYGNVTHRAVSVAKALTEKGISVGVLNLSTPTELDKEAILLAAKTGLIVTYEDHNVNTGISGGVAKILCENGVLCKLIAKGVSCYGESASPDVLYQKQGLDEQSLAQTIEKELRI